MASRDAAELHANHSGNDDENISTIPE